MLRRIAFIVFAQRVGLTLEEIGAELAKLPARPRADAGATGRASSTAWSARIDERIAELERLKLGLTECIGACSELTSSDRSAPCVAGSAAAYDSTGFKRALEQEGYVPRRGSGRPALAELYPADPLAVLIPLFLLELPVARADARARGRRRGPAALGLLEDGAG